MTMYRVVQKKWPLFENSCPSSDRQVGLPMHSQSANHGKFKLSSLNLAPFLLLNPALLSSSSLPALLLGLFCLPVESVCLSGPAAVPEERGRNGVLDERLHSLVDRAVDINWIEYIFRSFCCYGCFNKRAIAL